MSHGVITRRVFGLDAWFTHIALSRWAFTAHSVPEPRFVDKVASKTNYAIGAVATNET